jgi:hypothetical protein
LKDILDALAGAAATEAPRTALYVLEGSTLGRWADSWSSGPCPLPRTIEVADRHLISRAASGRTAATSAPADSSASSPSTPVTPDVAVALPVLVESESVAVLYGEGPQADGADEVSAWQNALEILVQHASACLSLRTAVRMLQATGIHREAELQAANPVEADGGSARRYARLLVSEIKLYNEAAVRAGRERRDLLARLGPEINRARRLYEERVPTTIFNRENLFEQELVQTLAEGDPALLGEPA